MAITPEQAFEMAGEMFSSTEDMEFSPIQEAYFEEIEAAQIVINTAADLQAMHGISVSNAEQAMAQAMQESTAADLINSGHYASPFVPLHVSSTTAIDEQGLIEYLGSAIQDTIDNYNPQTNAAGIADAVWGTPPINHVLPMNLQQMIDDAESHNAGVQPLTVETLQQAQTMIDEHNEQEEILVPTFEIASNPTVSLSEIKARRFYIVDGGKYTKPVPEAAWLFDDAENRFKLIDFD